MISYQRHMPNRLVVVVFSVILLWGCTIRLVYKHLDLIIPWVVSEYISLTTDQKNLFDEILKKHLSWHRITQLPICGTIIRDFKTSLKRGLTLYDLKKIHRNTQELWQVLVRQMTPDLAALLLRLDDDQINELLDNLDERCNAYEKNFIDSSEEKLRLKKVKRMTTFVTYWLDELTPEQEIRIENWSQQLIPIAPDRLDYLRATHARLAKLLKNRNKNELFSNQLTSVLYFKRETWPKGLKIKAKHNREATMRTLLQINTTLLPQQKKDMLAKLTYLSRFCEETAMGD